MLVTLLPTLLFVDINLEVIKAVAQSCYLEKNFVKNFKKFRRKCLYWNVCWSVFFEK